MELDRVDVASWFRERTPVRLIATLLLMLAVPIGAIWTFYSARFVTVSPEVAKVTSVQDSVLFAGLAATPATSCWSASLHAAPLVCHGAWFA